MPETRVVNRRTEEFDVYIGRGSEWGNPYSHQAGTKALYVVGTRREAIDAYESYLLDRINEGGWPFIERVAALKGKRLGCYCAPLPCHGDVLARAADMCARWLDERATP